MSNDTLKKNVIVQGSILAMASIIVRVIGLFYRIPLTRILGDTGMGYYGYAYEIYNLVLILSSYSLPLSVSKLVSARIVKKEYKNCFRVFKFSLAFGAFVGLIGTLVLYLAAEPYAKLISNENVAVSIKVLAPTIFVFSILGVFRGFFQGHSNMVPTAVSQVAEQIVNALVSIAAPLLIIFLTYRENYRLESAGATFGTLMGAVSALVVLALVFLYNRKVIRKRLSRDLSDESESYKHICYVLLITAIPVIISQTIYQIGGFIDSVIFNGVLTKKGMEEEVRSAVWGIYSNKYRLLTNVPIAVASAMGTAIVPTLISEYVIGNIDNVKQKISTVVKFNMIIAFPSAAGLIALAKPILLLLFGDGKQLSASMLQIGGICVVFFALSTVTNGILQGINRMSLPVIHSAISLVIHIPLLYILLKFTNLGVNALVICNCLFPFVVCVLNWISVKKKLDYRQEVLRTFILPFICSAIMGVFAFCLSVLLKPIGNILSTLIVIALAVLVYFFLLIKLKAVTREELLAMPKGGVLVRIFTKIKLL